MDIHTHEVEFRGRKYVAGTPATLAILGGALVYGARDRLPWQRYNKHLIVLLTLSAYAACFRREG